MNPTSKFNYIIIACLISLCLGFNNYHPPVYCNPSGLASIGRRSVPHFCSPSHSNNAVNGIESSVNAVSATVPCSGDSSTPSQAKEGNTCCNPSPTSTSSSSHLNEGSIGQSFQVNPYGPPLLSELADENIVKIVTLDATDEECNTLCWKCLGYRLVEPPKGSTESNTAKVYDTTEVFPKWLSKYPVPPDVIGVTRKYDGDIDRPVRQASMDLMRSIPRDFKGGVKSLTAVGFRLWKLSELTPNKTRRAQLCNWLIYYREKLFGKTIEQLREDRAREAEEKQTPVEVANLPSEKMYQKLRLD